jgi:hypothetical protein
MREDIGVGIIVNSSSALKAKNSENSMKMRDNSQI